MKKLAVLSSFVLSFTTAGVIGAQSDSARIPGDSILERARKLVNSGREADGRKIVDSVVHANTPQNPIYAEALYTRAAMAPDAAEAERDYRRLLIETPLAPRAEDALLQLANLLQARGDRRGASDHLQRFMLTYANSPARPRVALSLVRLLFEQGPQQQARACEALRMGRESIPAESLELRNQLEFYAPRCLMPVSEASPPPVAADSAAVPPATPVPAATPAASTSFYSVQIAAYNSREPAVSLANTLVERGLEARVDGTAAPF